MLVRFARLLLLGLMLASGPVFAEATVQRILLGMTHTERWNRFVDKLYEFHKQRLAGRQIKQTERIGGYFRQPKFYKEVSYVDAKTGLVLSRIQWENKHPDWIHVIAVFVYDDQGRVTRDFGAAFRTGDRDAPMDTMINFHAYTGKLHAFRQFNASNEVIYEKCTGSLSGRAVEIRLDLMDLIELEGETGTTMTTPTYKTCFGALPTRAGRYMTPQ